VLSQGYEPLELVVVDDGSADATPDVLARYASDPRVRIVVHDRNRGIPVAKNSVLNAMTATYGGILDSDDLLLPGAIEACVRAFEEQGEAVSQVWGDCVDSVSGELTGQGPREACLVRYEDALCDRFPGEYWNLFRVADLGRLRFHPDALTAETLVWHQMLKRKPGYYIGRAVRRYEKRGTDRISAAPADRRLAHGRMMAYKVYLDAFEHDVVRLCPTRFAALAQELAKWQARCGHRWMGVRTLIKAARAGGAPGLARAAAVVLMPSAAREFAYRRKAQGG
jgi:glycosyltransferase involved in cell wall biosynthesis